MTEDEISNIVIGLCIKIHDKFGPGLFESLYEAVLCYELDKNGLSYKRQQGIIVKYDDIILDIGFRADIIIEDKVIIEIKSIETVAPVHKKQVITYLKLTDIKLGLLINFNVNLLKEGIFRLVNNL